MAEGGNNDFAQPQPEKRDDQNKQLIIWNEYELGELIGSGSFGQVYECKHIKSGKTFAVKKFKNKFQSIKKAFEMREIQILKRFSEKDKIAQVTKFPNKNQGQNSQQSKQQVKGHCPYVMKAERIEFENRRLYLVFEKMDLSLTQYIRKRGRKGLVRLEEDSEIRTIMKQILIGLQYLHDEMGIMHRDLKPDNIMVNLKPLTAKIIDFGTCKDLSAESGPHTSYVSTRWYRAPECVLRSHHYNFVSDVFAAGCIMAEMYLQQPIFPGASELDQIDKIFRVLGTPKPDQWREGFKLAEKREVTFVDYPKKNLLQYLPGISEEAAEAVIIMLKISAQKRGTAAQVLKMPFFLSDHFTPSTQASKNQLSSNFSQSPPPNKNFVASVQNQVFGVKRSSFGPQVIRKVGDSVGNSSGKAQKDEYQLRGTSSNGDHSDYESLVRNNNKQTNQMSQYKATHYGQNQQQKSSSDRSKSFVNNSDSKFERKQPNHNLGPQQILAQDDKYQNDRKPIIYQPQPMNRRHNNKGSSSLVAGHGGPQNDSSEEDSNDSSETGGTMKMTTNPKTSQVQYNGPNRSQHNSQIRQHLPSLPQVSQARGTIKNQYGVTEKLQPAIFNDQRNSVQRKLGKMGLQSDDAFEIDRRDEIPSESSMSPVNKKAYGQNPSFAYASVNQQVIQSRFGESSAKQQEFQKGLNKIEQEEASFNDNSFDVSGTLTQSRGAEQFDEIYSFSAKRILGVKNEDASKYQNIQRKLPAGMPSSQTIDRSNQLSSPSAKQMGSIDINSQKIAGVYSSSKFHNQQISQYNSTNMVAAKNLPNSNQPRMVMASDPKSFNQTQSNFQINVSSIAKNFIDKHQTNYKVPQLGQKLPLENLNQQLQMDQQRMLWTQRHQQHTNSDYKPQGNMQNFFQQKPFHNTENDRVQKLHQSSGYRRSPDSRNQSSSGKQYYEQQEDWKNKLNPKLQNQGVLQRPSIDERSTIKQDVFAQRLTNQQQFGQSPRGTQNKSGFTSPSYQNTIDIGSPSQQESVASRMNYAVASSVFISESVGPGQKAKNSEFTQGAYKQQTWQGKQLYQNPGR